MWVIIEHHTVGWPKLVKALIFRNSVILNTSVPEVKIRLSPNVVCAKEDKIEGESLILFRVIHTRTFRHDLSSY
jgi:hypothetical protein